LPLIDVAEKLNGPDARIVHAQHDRIIVEAGENVVDRAPVIMKESVEEAFDL